MSTVIAVLVVVVVMIAVPYLVSYNRLVVDRQSVADSWGTIDAELERRHDLIPSLVESVQGAAAHERELLDDLVAKERNAALAAHTADARSDPERDLALAARAVVALRERYPALDTQQNFLQLQHELAITEDRLGAARRFYNLKVSELNRRTEAFPSNLVASRHGFERAAYFDPD